MLALMQVTESGAVTLDSGGFRGVSILQCLVKKYVYGQLMPRPVALEHRCKAGELKLCSVHCILPVLGSLLCQSSSAIRRCRLHVT